MKGYTCDKCGAELHYEQINGIRTKRIDKNGKYYFNVYCPICNEYFTTKR